MFGCISTQLIESNALIVLYLTLLGGSDSISMFSSGLTSLSHILLLIPCASFAARFGLRKTYTFSSAVGFLSFLLIAAAPYLAGFAHHAVLGGCFIYALTLTIYLSTWIPLLDNVLCSNERSAFFSRMRVTYMLFNAALLFVLGKFLNSNPSIFILQIVFIIAGLGLWGRKFCMDALPIDPEMRRESPHLKTSLSTCLHNQPLVGFSVYFCFLYLAFNNAMPLALVYMKTFLKMPDGTVVIISSLNLAGKLAGHAVTGRASSRYAIPASVVLENI
jgi:Na+/melibiose symporter-like transporter